MRGVIGTLHADGLPNVYGDRTGPPTAVHTRGRHRTGEDMAATGRGDTGPPQDGQTYGAAPGRGDGPAPLEVDSVLPAGGGDTGPQPDGWTRDRKNRTERWTCIRAGRFQSTVERLLVLGQSSVDEMR